MAHSWRRRHLVQLENRHPDSMERTAIQPGSMFVEIRPAEPGIGDEDHVTHTVLAPWHEKVTTDTVLLWQGRTLHVLGVQNIEERNRDMVLHCHEVKTPNARED